MGFPQKARCPLTTSHQSLKSDSRDQSGYLKVAGLLCSKKKCPTQAAPYPRTGAASSREGWRVTTAAAASATTPEVPATCRRRQVRLACSPAAGKRRCGQQRAERTVEAFAEQRGGVAGQIEQRGCSRLPVVNLPTRTRSNGEEPSPPLLRSVPAPPALPPAPCALRPALPHSLTQVEGVELAPGEA